MGDEQQLYCRECGYLWATQRPYPLPPEPCPNCQSLHSFDISNITPTKIKINDIQDTNKVALEMRVMNLEAKIDQQRICIAELATALSTAKVNILKKTADAFMTHSICQFIDSPDKAADYLRRMANKIEGN